MKKNCPNKTCSFYLKTDYVVKNGFYKRACDSRKIQRLKCKNCQKKFSYATGRLEFRQQKRRENPMLFKLLNSNMTMRRAAKTLNLSRATVSRRLKYFAKKSRQKQAQYLENRKKDQTKLIFLDDLITKENSKLKPLSISILFDGEKDVILGAQVSQIPSFGHLAKLSRSKYGYRSCYHQQGLDRLFEKTSQAISHTVTIKSDEHKKYPVVIRKYLPLAFHQKYKSERGAIVGQGELKKVGFDPLFKINHTCAMFRANISRLVRKTWCTTKKPQELQNHVDIFIDYFNGNCGNNLQYLPSQ